MLWKWVLVLLSSLVFIVAASIVIFDGMKNIRVKEENYITFEGLIEREIISTSSSWDLKYRFLDFL
ncbi:hypothetical protein BmHG_00229 [Borrelia miyamotoi]|uniref:Uncharacterized protein n=1 Tax=Borrelia miyamotoi TaxID=47466 RepID=A0AAP9CFX3_9SPIR|nr:hypothetical protein [Borrelia miyamotoi]ATQ14975.1 hypothetical protein CNO14_03155 [Borrelia miyamotoi]ATQ16158.1 hypothetical protein CNO13_03155 [Borrelia miyamotoi]ATQ17303.1 hypothetical protein CNO12_03160 [Borrelia miyamotoi]ATQ18191.1 hypothetical protein CNO11_01090 [Borrelia miyamotoi]ATQ19798.1 hypothetical protein CNO10_03160 [Borrelia miyamotoi]